MKKILIIFSILFLAGCAASKYGSAQLYAVSSAAFPSPTATIQSSATPIPSPTIDYQSTAIIAQQTADEARRVNVMVTAEFEQRAQEQIQITAAADQRNFEILSWTATAVLTSIARQPVIDTQIAQKQMLISAQLTSTKEAPTQIVAMSNAQNQARFGKTGYVVGIFANGAVGIFAIALAIFFYRRSMQAADDQPADEEKPAAAQTETIVHMKRDLGNGDFSMQRLPIPCTPEQLTELAMKITQGEKTLAINQWEGAKTLFNRGVILRVRNWMRDEKFVTATSDGQLVPTNDLLNFLCGWLDKQALPADYEFEAPHSPDSAATPNHGGLSANSLMSMANHAKNNGGGGDLASAGAD